MKKLITQFPCLKFAVAMELIEFCADTAISNRYQQLFLREIKQMEFECPSAGSETCEKETLLPEGITDVLSRLSLS